MKVRKTIVPAGLEAIYVNWHFAPIVVSNGMIYCSGIIGTSPGGEANDDSEAGAFEGARSTLRDAEQL